MIKSIRGKTAASGILLPRWLLPPANPTLSVYVWWVCGILTRTGSPRSRAHMIQFYYYYLVLPCCVLNPHSRYIYIFFKQDFPKIFNSFDSHFVVRCYSHTRRIHIVCRHNKRYLSHAARVIFASIVTNEAILSSFVFIVAVVVIVVECIGNHIQIVMFQAEIWAQNRSKKHMRRQIGVSTSARCKENFHNKSSKKNWFSRDKYLTNECDRASVEHKSKY